MKIPGIGIDIFFKNCQYWYWCWDRIEEYLVLVLVLVLTLKIPRIDIDIGIVILYYRMKPQYPLKRASIAHLCSKVSNKSTGTFINSRPKFPVVRKFFSPNMTLTHLN